VGKTTHDKYWKMIHAPGEQDNRERVQIDVILEGR